MRLNAKTPGEISKYDISKVARRVEIDPVIGVSMILGAIAKVTTNHGFNGGTNEEQIKILLKDAWEKFEQYEFEVSEITEMWNARKWGKAHTRAQTVSAIQSLKSKGTIVVTIGGGHGAKTTKYGLKTVIEGMANSSTEQAAPPVGAVKTESSENDKADKWIGDVILDRITELHDKYANSTDAMLAALNVSDDNTKNYTEAFKLLIMELGEFRKVAQENVVIQQGNATADNEFQDAVQSNFLELETYFKRIEEWFKETIQTIDGSYDERYWADQIKTTYRDAYKEGFKDGRESYREEFLVQFKAAGDELAMKPDID